MSAVISSRGGARPLERSPVVPDAARARSRAAHPAGSGHGDTARDQAARARRRSRRPVLLILLVATLLAILAVTQIQISQDAYQRAELEDQLTEEVTRIDSLRSQVAELESPARIVTEAGRLGMVMPDKVEFLRVPPRRAR